MSFVSASIGSVELIGLKRGDLVPLKIIEVSKEKFISNALIIGIGGFKRVVIGYFSEDRGYETIELRAVERSAIEVVSLIGSIIRRGDNDYSAHIHVALGMKTEDNKYSSYAGHLIEGEVYPLMEIFLIRLSNIDHSTLRSVWPHRFR